MNYEIANKYTTLKIIPKLHDIIYLGKYYKWNEKTMKCENWNIKEDKYEIIEINEIMPPHWNNYKIKNLRTGEEQIQQTHYTMYLVSEFDKLINNKPKQLTIFDFI